MSRIHCFIAFCILTGRANPTLASAPVLPSAKGLVCCLSWQASLLEILRPIVVTEDTDGYKKIRESMMLSLQSLNQWGPFNEEAADRVSNVLTRSLVNALREGLFDQKKFTIEQAVASLVHLYKHVLKIAGENYGVVPSTSSKEYDQLYQYAKTIIFDPPMYEIEEIRNLSQGENQLVQMKSLISSLSAIVEERILLLMSQSETIGRHLDLTKLKPNEYLVEAITLRLLQFFSDHGLNFKDHNRMLQAFVDANFTVLPENFSIAFDHTREETREIGEWVGTGELNGHPLFAYMLEIDGLKEIEYRSLAFGEAMSAYLQDPFLQSNPQTRRIFFKVLEEGIFYDLVSGYMLTKLTGINASEAYRQKLQKALRILGTDSIPMPKDMSDLAKKLFEHGFSVLKMKDMGWDTNMGLADGGKLNSDKVEFYREKISELLKLQLSDTEAKMFASFYPAFLLLSAIMGTEAKELIKADGIFHLVLSERGSSVTVLEPTHLLGPSLLPLPPAVDE